MIAPRPYDSARALARFLRTETVGGTVLLLAAFGALLWANSPWAAAYHGFNALPIGSNAVTVFGHPLHLRLTVSDWAKDALLAVFFFVAGLELKRELVVGELSTVRRATLPIVCASAGVAVPALIALAVAHSDPRIGTAWAIPIATDIAFALGVLALTGSRLPSGARVFLLGLAVVDDLIAIVVIAVLFSAALSAAWLAVAAVGCAGWGLAQRLRITSPLLYVPVAALVWIAMLQSGVHPTIAGVALGMLTRVRRDEQEKVGPAERIAHRVQPISAGICVPIFAFCASGVTIDGAVLTQVFTDRIALAVVLGLFIGKIVGIFGASTLAVRLKIAERPAGLDGRDILALSVLGAIGFTVSLLVAELSLGDDADLAKAAVLMTSFVASALGSVLLLRRGHVHTQGRPLAR